MEQDTRTWNEKLADIIKLAHKPLRRKDILQMIRDEGWSMETDSISVYLFNAVKAGVLAHIKIHPSKKGFYCNPDWVKDGKLKPEHTFKPYWER